MSKLYDVISKLDEIAAAGDEVPAGPEIPFAPAPVRKVSPFIRILTLSFVLVLVGIGCIWGIDWLKRSSVQQMVIETTEPAEYQAPVSETQSALPAEKETIDFDMISTVNSAFSLRQIDEQIEVDSLLAAEEKGGASRIVIGETIVKNTVFEPQPISSGDIAKPEVATAVVDQSAQISRWLHQAERLRMDGEWESAATLFLKVWENSGNPAVANNLAASLIRLDRPEEAYGILKEALEKTPDDKDLQSNFILVRQLTGR